MALTSIGLHSTPGCREGQGLHPAQQPRAVTQIVHVPTVGDADLEGQETAVHTTWVGSRVDPSTTNGRAAYIYFFFVYLLIYIYSAYIM